MSNIRIQEVKNGWIVIPDLVLNSHFVESKQDCFVYHTIKEIQDALPSLLKKDEGTVIMDK